MIENFNIVETDYTTEFNTMYGNIRQDLDNGLKVGAIKTKHGLSDGKWRKYYKQLVKDGIFKARKKEMKEAKYYTYSNGRFRSQKVINGRKYHIGTFKCKHDVELAVELMKECNWDLEQKQRIVNQVKRERSYNYEGY